MIDQDLARHGREFKRALNNNQYELAETGILFPKAQVLASGVYVHSVNGSDVRVDHNLLTTEGLAHMLDVVLNDGTKNSNWYLALYGANYTPTAGLTASSFPATASEITSATEGYTQSTRPAWSPNAVSGSQIDNVGSAATFTIATASSLDVNGAALLSTSTKGSTAGVLISATKFSATRELYDTDNFDLAYRVSLSSS